MRTVVTGGAGFIGSHLTEHLLARGDEVTVLDDLSTGSLDNLADVLDHPRLRRVHGTVLDRHQVDWLVHGADRVFHLAAAVGVRRIVEEPLQSLRVNLHGTENVLEAARAAGATVLLASTSEIYGKNDKVGLREDDDRIIGSPTKSRWSYSEAKAIDETLVTAYGRAGLRAVTVRLFNTVGPRQTGRYGMVVPRFVGQALAGDPLTVYGTGDQIRCFCHVADVVAALPALLAERDAIGGVFNLGSAEQVSIGQLARRVVRLTGSHSTIDRIPYQVAYGDGYEDMMRRVPDCRRARELIGFVPARDLDTILRDVVDEHRGTPLEDRVLATP
jgi:UDP-glucose 4-epimerase